MSLHRFLCCFTLCSAVTAVHSGARYALIIDSGSSGTRMYAYSWDTSCEKSNLPQVTAIKPSAAANKIPRKVGVKGLYDRVETRPGLDTFKHNMKGLQEIALGPLLDWARAVVPTRQHASTPVFLLATAGVRKLAADEQQLLLLGIRDVLAQSGFRFEPAWAKVITGQDEGIFGWIAFNYAQGLLHTQSSAPEGTVGVLDLGGSSLEVTYDVADTSPGGEDKKVALPGLGFNLRTQTLKRYGLNDAFDRSIAFLLQEGLPPHNSSSNAAQHTQHGNRLLLGTQQSSSTESSTSTSTSSTTSTSTSTGTSSPTSTDTTSSGSSSSSSGGGSSITSIDKMPMPFESPVAVAGGKSGSGKDTKPPSRVMEVLHPCMHAGYNMTYRRLQDYGIAPGTTHVQLVGMPDWSACQQLARSVVQYTAPCTVPPCKPAMTAQSQIKGKFVGLTGFYVVWRFFKLKLDAPTDAVLDAARSFCGMPWQRVQRELGENINVERYCLWGPYVVHLLMEGLQLQPDNLQIGSGDAGWPLGAVLTELLELPDVKHYCSNQQASSPMLGSRFLQLAGRSVLVLCALFLVLLALGCLCNQPMGGMGGQGSRRRSRDISNLGAQQLVLPITTRRFGSAKNLTAR